jgi:hypothetical protein
MDNPEKLATQGTQDENKQSKNTMQYVLAISMRKETQITQIRQEPSYEPVFSDVYAYTKRHIHCANRPAARLN